MSRIAVLGLGVMGSGIARRLVSSGHEVVAWNRSIRNLNFEVPIARSIAQAVSGADFVLYCLSNDKAVEDVVFGKAGVLDSVSQSTVVVDLSTISPELSAREHQAFSEKQIAFLDSPVFGSKTEAEAGGLWIVVGGKRAVFDVVSEHVYPHISETSHYIGEAGSGTSMKLVGNLLVASQLQALGEALTLAKAAGLDLQKVVEVLDVTDFRTPIYSGIGRNVIASDYEPHFSLTLLAKDLALIESLSDSLGVRVPTVNVVQASSELALQFGYGDLNASALIRAFSQGQGISL